MQKYIADHGIDDTDALIQYADALITKYGEAASAVACEMYDEMAQLQKADVPAAEPAPTPVYGEVAKAVNGCMKQSVTGALVPGAVSRQVKQTGADTTLRNAKRDGAYFAWVPQGDTCPYCLALAALGWQRAGKKTIKGDHAEHIHGHCDCEYAIDLKGDLKVSDYDPDKYLQQIQEATGDKSLEYDDMIKMWGHDAKGRHDFTLLNKIRRQRYAENKDYINAQKRAAYATRVEKSSIIKPEGLKMNLQFFAEKGIDKQSNQNLRKGIKSLQMRVSEHLEKIQNPRSVYDDWDDVPDVVRQGRINHWKKEIDKFNEGIKNRQKELNRRKENV